MIERADNRARLAGIYGILPADWPDERLLEAARAAIAGGVRILQLRDKKAGFAKRLKRARQLREITCESGALLIVNDSLQLALDAGADGVHFGREDLPKSPAAIRAEPREEGADGLIIGVSCKGDAAFARQMLNEGADYLSFGAIFPTSSKADAAPIGLPRLAKARQLFPDATICAIGGITQEALPAIRRAGADMAAVISALFGADGMDPAAIEQRARRMTELWERADQEAEA